MGKTISATTSDNKPRYELLDGLRGVAALLVVLYHFGEGFATSPVDQMMNHGYLAVDFFFVLSGFVIGYAYDSRWKNGNMTPWRFMLRRIIRLHPMVVLSVVLGALAFIIQGSVKWDGSPVPLHAVMLSLLMGLFLIPSAPGAFPEVRGNGEMFPLVGPSWSLFFEYIGSILYGFWLHSLSRKGLVAVLIISAIGLASCAFANISGAYHIGFGWSMADYGFLGGFFRLSFSFTAGLLLSRNFRKINIRGAFWLCAAIIAAVLSCPYVGSSTEPSILNAAYDIAATFFIFPAVVYLGACGMTSDSFSGATCEFLGRLSYPLYIIHYPAMYLFYAWVWNNHISFHEAVPVCVAIFFGVILAAWLALRFYDEPLRRFLSRKLLRRARD